MSSVHAATTVAVWAAAWQAGCAPDDVLAAIDGAGHRAGVRAASPEVAESTGLPGPGSSGAGSAALLPLLRDPGVTLLLPTAGDLRGLPVRGGIVVPALDAGAVVALPSSGLGLVPQDGIWRVYPCAGSHPAMGLREARTLLDRAVAAATATLVALDVARESSAVHDRIRALMLAEAVDFPPGTPRAASELLATVISLEAVLTAAGHHETGAVNSHQLAVVDDALRPLTMAVREGRRAAVAATVRTLIGAGVRTGF